MLKDTEIRYRADGSIDTSYYVQRGRALRSEAALQAVGRLTKPKSRWTRQVLNPFDVPASDIRQTIR